MCGDHKKHKLEMFEGTDRPALQETGNQTCFVGQVVKVSSGGGEDVSTRGGTNAAPMEPCETNEIADEAREQHKYRKIVHLWEFLFRLLDDKKFSSIISWSRKEHREFKLNNQEEVAKRWGVFKQKPGMNYDKLSRALRSYYKQGIIKKVSGQRLVYKFDKLPYEYKPRVVASRLETKKRQNLFSVAEKRDIGIQMDYAQLLTVPSSTTPSPSISHSEPVQCGPLSAQSTPSPVHLPTFSSCTPRRASCCPPPLVPITSVPSPTFLPCIGCIRYFHNAPFLVSSRNPCSSETGVTEPTASPPYASPHSTSGQSPPLSSLPPQEPSEPIASMSRPIKSVPVSVITCHKKALH